MDWCLSFHDYWRYSRTSGSMLEVALSGLVVSNAELMRFLETVELDLLTGSWVHLYEVAFGSDAPF